MRRAKDTVDQSQRDITLKRIKDAVSYINETGMKLTKAEIARIADLHINTLKKPYVVEYLNSIEGLGKAKEKNIEQYKERNEQLESLLKESRNANAKLRLENDNLRKMNREITEKYRYLLGEYIIQVGDQTKQI